jgi:Leucine-rich repeat (LRR) protein
MIRPAGHCSLIACVLLLSLAGCRSGPYTVSLNSNVLYSPNAAVAAGGVADPALQACINQVLAATEGSAAELKILACPDAGVRSLDGIRLLPALEQLELSNNAIDNLGPLQPLRNLRVLSLRNNDIRNAGPLTSLPLLRFLSLEGNEALPCRQLDELQEKLGNTLNRPAACQE